MAQWNKNTQSYRSQDTTLFEAVVIADSSGNVIDNFSGGTGGGSSTVTLDITTYSNGLELAAGNITGQSHINKFGYDENVGTVSYGTIWDGGSIYSYIGTPGVASVTSDDGGDTGNLVDIQGLDADYNLVTETVAVGSTGTQVFSRVFRAICQTECVGEVDIIVDSATRATVLAGAGQTLMALYTVPAGKTAYLLKFQGSIDKSNGEAKFRLMARPFGNGFQVKGQFGTAAGSYVSYDYPIPLKFEEKTDIEIRAIAGSTLGAGAIFDLVLVDNA